MSLWDRKDLLALTPSVRQPLCSPSVGKDLAPYRIGKHSTLQSRANIHKNTKIGFAVFLVSVALFCASGLSGPISRDTAILSLRYPISRNTF